MIRAALSFAIGFAAVVLLGAFITWDINPGNWDWGARYLVGFVGVVVGVLFVEKGEA